MGLPSIKGFAVAVGGFFKADPYIQTIDALNRENARLDKGETSLTQRRLESKLCGMEAEREAKNGGKQGLTPLF